MTATTRSLPPRAALDGPGRELADRLADRDGGWATRQQGSVFAQPLDHSEREDQIQRAEHPDDDEGRQHNRHGGLLPQPA